jgi:hypothetical protein
LTILAIVVPASVRFWVMFEIRFAPWLGPTMNRLGKPCTCMPWRLCMPSAQCVGERLAVAAVGLEAGPAGAAVPTSKPEAKIRQSSS